MPNHSKILGLILAGGAGRRVGGLDKGLVEYRGQPLIKHVLDVLQPQVHRIAIAANRNQKQYKDINQWVVRDKTDDHQGPMAGVEALINDLEKNHKDHNYDYLLIASCDAPHLPENLVQHLLTAFKDPIVTVAVVHDGQRRQNLHCLVRVSALASLITFYQQGGRAMHRWFEINEVREIDFSNSAEAFNNLNSIEQINSAEK